MLIQKTKGNLTENEEKFLSETVNQLKIIYVEESAREEKLNKDNQEKE